MRVTSRDPDRLVIHERAMVIRGFGMLLVALGAFCVVLIPGDRSSVVVPTVLAALLALAGLLMIVLPHSARFVFNRADKLCVITRRGVRGRSTENVRLRDIEAIEVDESSGSEGGTMYRLVFRLQDGRTLPWTSYYTGGLDAKVAVAEEAAEFLKRPNLTREMRAVKRG
ncbi:MAG: hypothetical protein ABJD07_05725 [Gemmatimonadaceae bacterium]